MYRLGKLIGYSLQQEVLFWTLIGLSITALEVFFPNEQHRKLLKTYQPTVVNVNIPNQPVVVNIKDPMGKTPVVVNITQGLDKNNASEKVTLNIKDTNNAPTVVVQTSEPEKIEKQILPKDENSSFQIFDFYTLRIYFLTYIILLYPVCVERKELLATPWIVVAGLRVFSPYLICRTYLWIIVYGYWIWLMDKKLQQYQGVPPHRMKTEPWQRVKKDEYLETRENRRRAKGIRAQVVRLSPSEVLGKRISLFGDNLNFSTDDLLNSVSPCSGLRDSKGLQDTPVVATESIDPSIHKEEEKEKGECEEKQLINRREERKFLKKKHRRTNEPIRVSDCILRQLSNLLLKLVEQCDKEIIDEGVVNRDSEIDIFRYYFSHSPDAAAALASQTDAFLHCPIVSKPRYLLDYPNIFGKGQGGRLSTDSSRSFGENNMFFCRSDGSLMRQTSLKSHPLSISVEELTLHDSKSSIHEEMKSEKSENDVKE